MQRFVTAAVTNCQAKSVTVLVTTVFASHGIVPGMVTPRNKKRPARRAFYLKEWRKFMGTKPTELADALDIERQSYHRLEKNWWTISTGEQAIICDVIGIKPSQLWFPPPEKGQQERATLDELFEDIPENMRPAAVMALRGMAGK